MLKHSKQKTDTNAEDATAPTKAIKSKRIERMISHGHTTFGMGHISSNNSLLRS